ncbi:hypothetical protein AHAS_Ahas06G0197600 [Arachis hypogaea]
MPYLNILTSFDKTKNMVKNLGLDYQKIDSCFNHCMLFQNGYENDSSCHVCGTLINPNFVVYLVLNLGDFINLSHIYLMK